MKYLFCIFTICLYSLNSTCKDIKDILSRLDYEISQKDVYLNYKNSAINGLKQRLSHSETTLDSFNITNNIFNEYKSYQYDSAYVYANRTLELARKLDNKDFILISKGNILFCLFSGGAFYEAKDIIKEAEMKGISTKARGEFYSLCTRLYSDLYYFTKTPEYRQSYKKKMTVYRDSVIFLLPDTSYIHQYIKALYLTNSVSKKQTELKSLLINKSADSHQKAIILSNLANLYLEKNDTLSAVECLAESSIQDLKAGIMETTSKTELARCLYSLGYIKEANKYVHLALEEANFYNASHRIISINSILPIIENTYLNTIKKQRDNLRLYLWIVSLLSACALLGIYMILKQKNRLQKAGKAIEMQSASLKELNEIKDAYIMDGIRAKSDFLDKAEDILKKADYRIKAKQYNELNRIFVEFNLKEERKHLYYSFDRTFLMLFPDFITEYNKLFDSDNQIILKNEEGLTPELRIFALIRLGIKENEEIARFLNLSVNTIYAYKTKVKAKTIVPKEQFEEFISMIKKKND